MGSEPGRTIRITAPQSVTFDPETGAGSIEGHDAATGERLSIGSLEWSPSELRPLSRDPGAPFPAVPRTARVLAADGHDLGLAYLEFEG